MMLNFGKFKELVFFDESSQMGGPKGPRRTKKEELDIAKMSPIYKKTQYEGWDIEPTVHAAAQAYDRRPGYEFSDWKKLHRKAIIALKDGDYQSGDFIVFSKSKDQGYVFNANFSKKKIRIITVLPKGRKNPQPGTTLMMVEGKIIEPLYIEVE